MKQPRPTGGGDSLIARLAIEPTITGTGVRGTSSAPPAVGTRAIPHSVAKYSSRPRRRRRSRSTGTSGPCRSRWRARRGWSWAHAAARASPWRRPRVGVVVEGELLLDLREPLPLPVLDRVHVDPELLGGGLLGQTLDVE
jgi:hypothetical protein